MCLDLLSHDVAVLSPNKGVQHLDVFREAGHALDVLVDKLFPDPDFSSAGSFRRVSGHWKGWDDEGLNCQTNVIFRLVKVTSPT